MNYTDLDIDCLRQQLEVDREAQFRASLDEGSLDAYDAYVDAEKLLMSDISRAFQASAPLSALVYSHEVYFFTQRVVEAFPKVMSMRSRWLPIKHRFFMRTW